MRKTLALVLSANVIWATYPLLSGALVQGIGAFNALFWTMSVATVFLLTLAGFRGDFKQIKKGCPWKEVVYYTLLIGGGYYGLSFLALNYTTPGNLSLLALLEILLNYLVYGFILKTEIFSKKKFLGAIFMVLGAGVVLFSNSQVGRLGDLLVLVAVLFPSFGNHFSKKSLEGFSSVLSRGLYSLFTTFFFLALALISEGLIMPPKELWWVIAVNGVLAFAISKVLLFEAYKHANISFVLSFLSLGPPLTLLLDYAINQNAPSKGQLLSLPFILFGFYLLIKAENSAKKLEQKQSATSD